MTSPTSPSHQFAPGSSTTVPSTRAAAPLSTAELLFGDFALEYANTRRMLERYPDGKGDFRPHPRSRSLAELATHVADIVYRGIAVLESDGMESGARRPLTPMDSAAQLLAHFEAGRTRFAAMLAGVDLDVLAQTWRLRRGDVILQEHPRRILLRQLMMSHLVHHRAQLGVYYRLIGVPVPGTYGPSADD
jgi:uncharacterized damage-inducible protein DinB